MSRERERERYHRSPIDQTREINVRKERVSYSMNVQMAHHDERERERRKEEALGAVCVSVVRWPQPRGSPRGSVGERERERKRREREVK